MKFIKFLQLTAISLVSIYVASVNAAVANLTEEFSTTHAPRNDIETARNSTVFIDSGFGSGTGFFVNESCIIVTNKHVVHLDNKQQMQMAVRQKDIASYINRGVLDRDARKGLTAELESLKLSTKAYKKDGYAKVISITLVNGKKIPVILAAASEKYDLAYLKLAGYECPFLTPDLSSDLPLGHRVFAIGNPSGLKYTVTSGIVSGYHDYDDIEFIQTDAAINPGNSGGPLVDGDGRIVGINSMILNNTEGIGFALPVTTMLADLKASQRAIDWTIAHAGEMPAEVVDKQAKVAGSGIDDAAHACMEEFDNEEYGAAREPCEYAAMNGNHQAQFALAQMTYGGKYDEVKAAVELYKKSADGGYGEAILVMASFYENGKHVRRNGLVSNDMYLNACEKKVAHGCRRLGEIYSTVSRYDEALGYYRKAMEYGSLLAEVNVGLMYEEGLGVPQNEELAQTHYLRAANLGNNIGQLQMARSYFKGIGVPKKYSEAYVWLLVAETDQLVEEDRVENWRESISEIRFSLNGLLSASQKMGANSIAMQRVKKISIAAEEHQKKYRYQRPGL